MRRTAAVPRRAAGLRKGDLAAPLTTKFSQPARDSIDKLARRHGVSSGDIVRLAVADYIARSSPSSATRRRVRTR